MRAITLIAAVGLIGLLAGCSLDREAERTAEINAALPDGYTAVCGRWNAWDVAECNAWLITAPDGTFSFHSMAAGSRKGSDDEQQP